jgi:hypothetical protein
MMTIVKKMCVTPSTFHNGPDYEKILHSGCETGMVQSRASPEPGGLRVKLPPNRESKASVAVGGNKHVSGDFEITGLMNYSQRIRPPKTIVLRDQPCESGEETAN